MIENLNLLRAARTHQSPMEVFILPLLFSIALFLLLGNSTAADTIAPNKTIADGDTIVSAGDIFEFDAAY